ncbi:hypothetical protein [Aureimonas sp. AU12]|uniref:hypothetical protein n=1 Tax=Aureimonas sp. AU12 TaxID=1638161 RepID=UPI0012E3D95A|nr:hypothetical protein [Aureimonas sp. AU12]
MAIVQSRRLQERSTDVTRGGAISGVALEREFSVIGTVLQELRRDINNFDGLGVGGGAGIVTINDVVGLVPVLAAKASVSAVQALSASIVSLASRTIVGAGLASASVASLVTTVTVPIATRAQAEAGILNDVAMTPQRVAQAIAAIGGGGGGETDPADAAAIVRTPTLFEKTDATTLSRLFYADGGGQDIHAQKLVSARIAFNSDNDREVSSFHIRTVSEGSALNGPRSATLAASISLFKEGFGTGTARGGEMDGLYIVVRQDGPRVNSPETDAKSPNRSDACGILIDAAFFDKTGFTGGIEGATTLLSGTGGGNKARLSYQIGCMNAATGTDRIDSIGLYAAATVGKNSVGLLLNNFESTGGYFDKFIECGNDSGQIFSVDRFGTVSFGKLRNDGYTLDAKMHMTLQADASLGWVNSNKSVQIMSLDQGGNLSVFAGLSAANMSTVGNVAAGGKVIATSGFQGRMINLTPGAYEFSASQLGNYKRGDIFIGAGGRPRICTADGTQPLFLYTTSS